MISKTAIGLAKSAIVKRAAMGVAKAPVLNVCRAYRPTPLIAATPIDTEGHKVTAQALIHEIAMQQMESTAAVVPWFLDSMPVS